MRNPGRKLKAIDPGKPDPRLWLKMAWTDRHSRSTFHITTSGFTGSEGVARVKTIADVLADYRVHPESKSLGPDDQPCGRATIGLLHRRPVTGINIEYVGKESNRLEEVQAGLVHDPEEVLTVISDPHRGAWLKLVLPVLRDCPLNYLTKRTGRSASTLRRIRAGVTRPSPDFAPALIHAAGGFARRQLKAWSMQAPTGDLVACHAYLRIESSGRSDCAATVTCRGECERNIDLPSLTTLKESKVNGVTGPQS